MPVVVISSHDGAVPMHMRYIRGIGVIAMAAISVMTSAFVVEEANIKNSGE